MKLTYEDRDYDVIIEKKRGQKNTYIRVKKDLKIYVTCNTFTLNYSIEKLIQEHYKQIIRMIDAQKKKEMNNNGFFYLGKKYVLIHSSNSNISFMDDKVYVPSNFDIDSWYRKMAKELFQERLDEKYNQFSRNIPKPVLRIRKMTTRWGVCNIKTHVITLNLELIKRDVSYLDYVIVHELSHLVYGDHSTRFWNLVGENMSNYKKYRDDMKEF